MVLYFVLLFSFLIFGINAGFRGTKTPLRPATQDVQNPVGRCARRAEPVEGGLVA